MFVPFLSSDSGESDSEHTYGEVEGRMETDSTKPQPPLPDAERNTSKPAMFDRVLGFFSSSRSHSSSDASAAGPPGGKGRSSKGHHWKLGSKESMSGKIVIYLFSFIVSLQRSCLFLMFASTPHISK